MNTYQDGQVETHIHNTNLSVNTAIAGTATGNLSGTTGLGGNHRHHAVTNEDSGADITTGSTITNVIAAKSTALAPSQQQYILTKGTIEPDIGMTSFPKDPVSLALQNGSGDHAHSINGTVNLDTSSLGINTTSSLTMNAYGGNDPDNPNKTRPDNLSLYLLIKT